VFSIHKRNTFVAIDIGTASVKAAMGEILKPSEYRVLGVCQNQCRGLRKGNIVDIKNTAEAVEIVLNELERLTGVEIYSALIGFSGRDIYSTVNHAAVTARGPDFEITEEDKERVLQAACDVSLPSDKTLVQTIIRQYVVDGYEDIKEPAGMAGSRLEAFVTLVVAATAVVQNIQRCTAQINLKIDRLVYNPLLAAESVLLPLEKEMGVVLIDIGAGTTEISFFAKGNLFHASVIPLGDEYFSKDLSLVLRTSWEEANRLKELYGMAEPGLAGDDEELIELRNTQGKEKKQVTRKMITEIIHARLVEMIELIYVELQRYGIIDNIPSGIVLTGGGAGLRGIVELLEENLDIPVRLGKPENIRGISEEYNKPHYANVLGGLQYISDSFDEKQLEIRGVPKIWDNITFWVKDLFR
jgi:cell division protein FtsA